MYSDRQRQFEEYVRDGITAARNGDRHLAEVLLNRALLVSTNDARPYLWLSACTDDPAEQLEYLEKAVAADPTNTTARRGLAMLRGKLAPAAAPTPPAGAPRQVEPSTGYASGVLGGVDATGKVFLCPKCGGRMSFALEAERLTCEYCGFSQGYHPDRRQVEELEQVLDFVMPTKAGHHWATDQQQLKCEQCGALNLLPPGSAATTCAYCGSNQLIRSTAITELIEPHAVILMKIEEQEAYRLTSRWLGRGLFAPDTLATSGSSMRLRPAYFSCWTFDGTAEVRWNCEVAEGSGNNKHWRPVTGVAMRIFNDFMVSGVKAFPDRDLDRVGPFELPLAEVFRPDFLAGWTTLLYDLSLSDASLVAREKVLRWLRPTMSDEIEPGTEKRNITIGGGSFHGLTFKHILVPVWQGEYLYKGKSYRLLVNGQNGKVVGDKPKDTFKVWMAVIMVLLVLGLIAFAIWILRDMGLIY